MRYCTRWLVLLPFLGFACLLLADPGKKRYADELSFLVIPAKSLPEGCSLAEVTGPSKWGITENPTVAESGLHRALFAVVGFGLSEESIPEGTRAAISVGYQEKKYGSGLGVYALLLKDEDTAERILKKVKPVATARTLIRKGSMLISLARNKGFSDKAFEAVRRYYEETEWKPSKEQPPK